MSLRARLTAPAEAIGRFRTGEAYVKAGTVVSAINGAREIPPEHGTVVLAMTPDNRVVVLHKDNCEALEESP